jgi:SAM-dependent methyltransferase
MWDERYAAPEYFYGTEANDFLREQAPAIPKGGKVLCLGEGEGRNAAFLASLWHGVSALDQSKEGLRKALALAASRGVRISTIHADLGQYDIGPGTWDAIVSIWCHLPSAVRARVHSQVVAGLKPGGVFILEAYRPEQLGYGTGGPKEPDLLPTLAVLRQELAGLQFEHATETVRDVREGRGHSGQSAVVQVVARRALS